MAVMEKIQVHTENTHFRKSGLLYAVR